MKVKTDVKAGPMFEQGDVSIEVDEDGFIVNPDNLTEAAAKTR